MENYALEIESLAASRGFEVETALYADGPDGPEVGVVALLDGRTRRVRAKTLHITPEAVLSDIEEYFSEGRGA